MLDNDFTLSDDEEFLDASDYNNSTNFDAFGRYRKGTITASTRIDTDLILQITVLPDGILIAKLSDNDSKFAAVPFKALADDIFYYLTYG